MIDLGWLGYVSFNWNFLMAVLTIVLIDLVLAGDNAVVIAMAVRKLQGSRRRLGILLGAGGAIMLRVAGTFMVAQLLTMPFVKFIGGAIVIWIAVKLLTEGAKGECHGKESRSLGRALWLILVADLSMGIDNMLAVGAASQGNLFLLLFGLVLSIPFVVFMSNVLSRWMDRYPIILWIGAAVLGRVGGEMMISDPWIVDLLNPPAVAQYATQAFFVAFVCLFSRWVIGRRKRAAVNKPVSCIPGQTESA